MDNRTFLSQNEELVFPGMTCLVEQVSGIGSNVIAYTGRYRDHQNPDLTHRILVRELFPYDPQGGVRRGPGGELEIDPSSTELFAFNKMTFLRGNEVHVRLTESIPAEIDMNINTFEYNNTLYSLLGYTGGRTLEEDLQKQRSSESSLLQTVRILRGALQVLDSFHEAGYLHLDISPDNILLVGEGDKERVTLIDYNSVHTMQEIRSRQAVYYSTKEGYTAPEVRTGKIGQIRPCTDLYSMTAVLYRCLSGSRLTPLQMLDEGVLPEGMEAWPVLQGCPETVLSMVRRILRRGLSVLPRRRYQRVPQMRRDLDELEDRILGRGITHWALWEAGRRRIRRSLAENPALDYVLDDRKLYPLYAQDEAGQRLSLTHSPVEQLNAACPDAPLLLLGGGGMGKTTALYRIACSYRDRYSAFSPAVFYISLYGYKGGEKDYLCDSLLESLKFKPHTDNMETARKELLQLLDTQPAGSGRGAVVGSAVPEDSLNLSPDRPFLLLLDGLNEASGDTAPLLEEIHRLAGLAGVRIILTGRSDPADPLFTRLLLCRLEQDDIRKILAAEGMLPPENMEVFDLLSFPMLLSMYIRAVRDGGKNLRVQSREDLLDDYFAAILEKERGSLPESHAAPYGIDAAVRFLLPEIALQTAGKKCALSPQEMMKVVQRGYKALSNRAVTAVFEDWAGHMKELRLGADTADAWYGSAVLEILWKRTGLLVRDENGNFRLLHQMIEDYLVEKGRAFHERFDREKRRQMAWGAIFAAVFAFLLAAAFGAYNWSVNRELSRRQQEILRNESRALAYSSEGKRREGDRPGAIADALDALPSQEQERPYVAEAESALTSALYVYSDEEYHPSGLIHCENTIISCVLSEDGTWLAALDEYGQLSCYRLNSSACVWKTAVDFQWDTGVRYTYDREKGSYERTTAEPVLPYLCILEEQNAVLYAGDSGEACLFDLETGQVRWRIPYEYTDEAEVFLYNPICFATVTKDGQRLVLGLLEQIRDSDSGMAAPDLAVGFEPGEEGGAVFVKEQYLNSFEYQHILQVYDTETGELLVRSGDLPVPQAYSCQYSGRGICTQDSKSCITSFYDTDNQRFYLVQTDLLTGRSEFLGEAVSDDYDWSANHVTGLYEVPTETSSETGNGESSGVSFSEKPDGSTFTRSASEESRSLVFYSCQYSVTDSDSISGDVRIGLFSMEENKWLFFRKDDLVENAWRLPDIYYNRGVLLAAGNNIRRYDPDGNLQQVFLDRKTACSVNDPEKGRLFLAFEDGTAGRFDPDLMALEGREEKTYTMTEGTIRPSAGPGRPEQPFCAVSGSDPKTVCIFSYYEAEQRQLAVLLPDDAGWESPYADSTVNDSGLYKIPGKEGFLYLEQVYDFYGDSLQNEHYCGTVYDGEGKTDDSFTIVGGSGFLGRPSLTPDGKILFWNSAVYFLDTHELYPMREEIDPETSLTSHEGAWTHLSSAGCADGVLSAYWENGHLHLFHNGQEEEVIDPPGEFAFRGLSDAVHRETLSPPEYAFRNLIVGENGLILLLRCNSGEISTEHLSGFPAEYYQVYSTGDRKWHQIENASSILSFPCAAAAQEKPLFAGLDESGRLMLYDAEQEKCIADFQTDVDLLTVTDLCFLMKDEYVMVQTHSGLNRVRIFRCSDGKEVYSASAGTVENSESALFKPYYEEESQCLFLMDQYGRYDGICIHTENWNELYTVRNLRCVPGPGAMIVKDPDAETPSLFRRYDLASLITAGQNVRESYSE